MKQKFHPHRDDVQKLYEYWCELAAPVNYGDSGQILDSFPANYPDTQTVNLISDFAYPCELAR